MVGEHEMQRGGCERKERNRRGKASETQSSQRCEKKGDLDKGKQTETARETDPAGEAQRKYLNPSNLAYFLLGFLCVFAVRLQASQHHIKLTNKHHHHGH